jgi:protein-disulfide isomerase
MPAHSGPVPETPEEIKADRQENIIAIVITLVVLAALGFFLWHAITQREQPTSDRVDVPVGSAPTLGNADAPITVVIFSDFECPFCGEFSRSEFPKIREQFVDSGQVRVAFRHFPIATHLNALPAAEAAACAQDFGKFWEYHDTLFTHQSGLDRDSLIRYATELGINETEFRSCLDGDSRLVTVTQDREWGLRLGVAGTPTFFFNGRAVPGALTAEEFAQQVAIEISNED